MSLKVFLFVRYYVLFISSRDSGRDRLRLIKEDHHQEGFHRNLGWDPEGQFHPYLDLIRYCRFSISISLHCFMKIVFF